jgi:hypothetical protein
MTLLTTTFIPVAGWHPVVGATPRRSSLIRSARRILQREPITVITVRESPLVFLYFTAPVWAKVRGCFSSSRLLKLYPRCSRI